MLNVFQVAAGGGEVAYVSQLLGRAKVASPVQLGDDQVLFAHNPGGEVLNDDALPPLELCQSVRGLLADDEIDFDHAVFMNGVEHEPPGDGV